MVRRSKELFLVSVGASLVFLIAGLVVAWINGPVTRHPFIILQIVMFFASLMTLAVYPVTWFLFRRKEPRRVASFFLIWFALGGGICSFLHSHPFVYLGAPIFLLSGLLVWSFLLPNVHDASNACYKCGYDLTGNVSGRCPECGVPIAEGEFLRSEALTSLKGDE